MSSGRARGARAALALGFALALAQSAWADDGPVCGQTAPDDPDQPYDKLLLRDPAGLRSAIGKYGLTFGLTETDEVLGNPSGGTRRGAIYEGLTDTSLKLDLRPYFHWRGVFCIRAFQIRGRGLSANDLGNNIDDRELDRGRPRHPAVRVLVRAAYRRLAAHPHRPAGRRPGIPGLLDSARFRQQRLRLCRPCRRPICPRADRPTRSPPRRSASGSTPTTP